MDNFNFNIENADEIEVWVLFFPAIKQTLLIDTRSNVYDGPLVRVLPMVSSIEDRIKNLMELRPSFPMTEKIVFVPLPLDIAGLQRSNLWVKILERFAGSDRATLAQMREALNQLSQTEHEVKASHTNEGAVRGAIGFETLWERDRS